MIPVQYVTNQSIDDMCNRQCLIITWSWCDHMMGQKSLSKFIS